MLELAKVTDSLTMIHHIKSSSSSDDDDRLTGVSCISSDEGCSWSERSLTNVCHDPIFESISSKSTPSMFGEDETHIESIAAMKISENLLYLHSTYLEMTPKEQRQKKPDNSEVLPMWREKLCNWMFSFIDHINMARRTVAVSMNLFDRFLATIENQCDGKQVILISLTTLYISIKVHEPKKIPICAMSELSRNLFSPNEIRDMELQILHNLQWLVHPPVPSDFLSFLLKLLPVSVEMPIRCQIHTLTNYVVQLSLFDLNFVEVKSSTIAFAAILNVLDDNISYDAFPKKIRISYLARLYSRLLFDQDNFHTKAVRQRLRYIASQSKYSSIVHGHCE